MFVKPPPVKASKGVMNTPAVLCRPVVEGGSAPTNSVVLRSG